MLLVVGGHEVGVGGDAFFDVGIFPRSTLSAGFAELPAVVDGSRPERGLSVVRADDVRVVRGGVCFDAAEDEEPAIGAEVVDGEVVGGNRAHFSEAAGVARREFVEGAAGVEEVALGCDFASDAVVAERVFVEVAFGEAPAIAVVIGVND